MRPRHDAWPQERRERLLVLVEAGLTAKEAGVQLGCSRNAILGYAHRNSIIFPLTAEKKARCRGGRPPLRPKPALTAPKLPPGHPSWLPRPFGQRAFSDGKIAIAIAARLAGASRLKAARLIGAGQQILSHWEKIPELAALGRDLFERAKADAGERAARARVVAAFQAEAERLNREQVNAAILARMPDRHRAMLQRRITGETLQEVGEAFGVSRERIRQVEAKWRTVGLIVPGVRPLSESTVARFGWHEPRRRGRKPKAVDFWALADASPKPKQKQNLSDAERARRAEHMRSVSRAMWDARA